MPPPESPPPLELETLRAPSNSRVAGVDDETGATTIEIVDDFGEYRNTAHGLISGETGREFYSILPGDPLSVRAETYQEQRADAERFHIKARMEAYESEDLIFEREWTESVKRNLL